MIIAIWFISHTHTFLVKFALTPGLNPGVHRDRFSQSLPINSTHSRSLARRLTRDINFSWASSSSSKKRFGEDPCVWCMCVLPQGSVGVERKYCRSARERWKASRIIIKKFSRINDVNGYDLFFLSHNRGLAFEALFSRWNLKPICNKYRCLIEFRTVK
jgi:hypothetical protein